MTDNPQYDELMVQRKLSGVYDTRSVEISYEIFEQFIDDLRINLFHQGLTVTNESLVNNPKVVAEFDKQITEFMKHEVLSDMTDHFDNYNLASTLFGNEIQNATINSLQNQLNALQDANSINTIVVPEDKAWQARQILQLAGIIK